MGVDKKFLSERDICTKFSLCDALEAGLQSAEEERGRLVAPVMSGVGWSDGK